MATHDFDGCEWNPHKSRLSYDADEHYRTTPATVLVGANGDWRLCAACAALPKFRRYRVRKAIQPFEILGELPAGGGAR